jgi:hypothetical protein
MTFLLFITLLSQSKIFDVLIDTVLGRFLLILFIIVLSYVHQILGVVAVLFTILVFNASGFRLEGFEANDNTAAKVKEEDPRVVKTITTSSTKVIDDTDDAKTTAVKVAAMKASTTNAIEANKKKKEGFETNILNLERTIQKGKRENVTSYKQDCDEVVANEEGTSFAPF